MAERVMTALFSELTARERSALAGKLLSGSRELISEKMRLRSCGDLARDLYGTDADAYVGAIDDVHAVLWDLFGTAEPAFAATGTGWPVP